MCILIMELFTSSLRDCEMQELGIQAAGRVQRVHSVYQGLRPGLLNAQCRHLIKSNTRAGKSTRQTHQQRFSNVMFFKRTTCKWLNGPASSVPCLEGGCAWCCPWHNFNLGLQ
jgi:hypothetical protein